MRPPPKKADPIPVRFQCSTLPVQYKQSTGATVRPLRTWLLEQPEAVVWQRSGAVHLGTGNVTPSVCAVVGCAIQGALERFDVLSQGEITDYHAALSATRVQTSWLTPETVKTVLRQSVARPESCYKLVSSVQVMPDAPLGVDGLLSLYRQMPGWLIPSETTDGQPETPAAGPRLALVGAPIGRSRLLRFLRPYNVRFVYDEWLNWAAGLLPNCDTRLAGFPFGLGRNVSQRQKLLKSVTSVEGVIIEYEPFAAHALDEVWVHQTVDVPVFSCERSTAGPLDAGLKNRLEAFLEQLMRART